MQTTFLVTIVCLCLAVTQQACGQFGQDDDYWWGYPIARSGNVTYYRNGGAAVHSGVRPFYTGRGYAVPGRQTVYSNGFTVTRIGNREFYHMSNVPSQSNDGSSWNGNFKNYFRNYWRR